MTEPLGARLLNPAHDPPRSYAAGGWHGDEWMKRADARLWAYQCEKARADSWKNIAEALEADLQEAVKVLAATSTAWPTRAISPELALMWATVLWRHSPIYEPGDGAPVAETPEDYLEAMVADGLRVRGRGDG